MFTEIARIHTVGPRNKKAKLLADVHALSAEQIVDEIACRKRKVVYPLFGLSFTLFLASLLALAYWPEAMGFKLFGAVNVAYALALSQFALTFAVAAFYARWARLAIDPLTSLACERLAGRAANPHL